MMESWQHSAKILITYFHAICHGKHPDSHGVDEGRRRESGVRRAGQSIPCEIEVSGDIPRYLMQVVQQATIIS